MKTATVVGGGLAGSEAAHQLAKRGINVHLVEARGAGFTDGAHITTMLGELVCSNSLGSKELSTAGGMLKAELRSMGSLIIEAADNTTVPAGSALAVNRELFASYIQKRLEKNSLITISRQEVTQFPSGHAIIATGPLTSDAMSCHLKKVLKEEHLHFFDAISPIIDGESIDYTEAFWGARYQDEGDYLNCPMTEAQYARFYNELLSAQKTKIKEFEQYFEGCMPIEEMAARGEKTMLFGPLKPVGLKDASGKQPFCVCQLRKEDLFDSGFNMVGFQTRLKRPEQKRVFGYIPALANARYLRYGSVHRNTFLNAPAVLKSTLQFKEFHNILAAGQITGVEGYVESTAMGLMAGVNLFALLNDMPVTIPGPATATGALLNYITSAPQKTFQPMNINFGIISALEEKIKSRKEKRKKIVTRGLKELENWKNISNSF